METQPTTEQKKSFLQNDRMLVCGMLVIYGICILGAIGGAFWGLNRRSQTIATNETATAVALSTQQAQVAGTAVARLAEQDQYEYIERFDKVTGDWFVGEEKGSDGDLVVSIKDGVYSWEIDDAKGYIQGEDFYRKSTDLKDYDIYVDVKFVEISHTEDTCAGLAFRKSIAGWRSGAYVFYICDEGYYAVEFVKADNWEVVRSPEYSYAIKTRDWNRIEVSAIGDHLSFTINNTRVFETIDTRRDKGGISLYIDAPDGESTVIWFDNFGFQSH